MTKLAVISLTAILATGCSSFGKNPSVTRQSADSTTALRQNTDAQPRYENRIERHLYAGIGFGPSRMNPDTSQAPAFDVDETVDAGGQLTLGMDLSRQWSLELHTANLGSAGLSPQGRINYSIHGASALFYLGKNRHNYRRHGFSGFTRFGYAVLQNSAEDGVDYEQVNPSHFLFGAGLEYMTRLGLGLRLEGIAFEEDAQYAQLGLIYRTGRRDRRRTQTIETVERAAPEPIVAPEPLIAPPVPALVVQEVYEPAPVNTCSQFNGTLEGVTFHSDSARLTDEANFILEDVAVRLSECSSTPVSISAHTDSVGNDQYNQDLSRERAKSVLRFLVQRGIDIGRMNARAFGETKPIDTNDTPEGRKRNRRVELIAH